MRGVAMGFIDEYRNGSKCVADYVNYWRYKRNSSIVGNNNTRNREELRWKY